MFRRRKREPADSRDPRELYDNLRSRALEFDPASIGLQPNEKLPRVCGALLETGFGKNVATLLSLSDGTTSLYTTSGFIIVGGGAHAKVVKATQQFLAAVDAALESFDPDPDASLPADGETIIRALTYDGRRSIRGPEKEFGKGRHPQSAVFYAGHDVITELRKIDESRRRQRRARPQDDTVEVP